MSLLISLPTELSAVILQEWIGNMRDICSLDAAFCVHGKLHHFFTSKRFKSNNQMKCDVIREDYLQILQYPHFRLPSYAFSASKNSTKRMVDYLNWLYKRHLKPTILYVPVVYIPQLVQLEHVDSFVSKLKQCYLVHSERTDSSYRRADHSGSIIDGSNLLNSLFSMFFSMDGSSATGSSSAPSTGSSTTSSLICTNTIPSIPQHILIPHVQQFFKKLSSLQCLSCELYPQINSHFFQLTCLPATISHSLHEMNLSHCHQLQDTDISMMIHQYRYSLEHLTIYDHPTMTGDCLLTIVQYAQQLTSLTLSYCASLQPPNLSIFCMAYTRLQSIQMMGNEVLSEEMFYWLLRRNKALKRVNIIDCKHISKDFVLGLLINDHALMTRSWEGSKSKGDETTGYLMNGLEYLNTDFLLYTNTHTGTHTSTNSTPTASAATNMSQGVTLILKASNQLSSADIDLLLTAFPLPIHHCQFLQTYKLQLHNLWSLLGHTKVKHPLLSFACNPWKYSYPIPGIPTTATGIPTTTTGIPTTTTGIPTTTTGIPTTTTGIPTTTTGIPTTATGIPTTTTGIPTTTTGIPTTTTGNPPLPTTSTTTTTAGAVPVSVPVVANEAAILPSLLIFTQFLEVYGATLQSLTLPNNPYLLTTSYTGSTTNTSTSTSDTTSDTTGDTGMKTVSIFGHIALHCPALRVLNLHRTPYPLVPPSLTDLAHWHTGICEILYRCSLLEVLDLSYCVFVNDSCVQQLCDLLDVFGDFLKVKTINLLHTNVTSQSIARILYHDDHADTTSTTTTTGTAERMNDWLGHGHRRTMNGNGTTGGAGKREVITVYMSDHYQYQYQYLTNTMSTVHAQQLQQLPQQLPQQLHQGPGQHSSASSAASASSAVMKRSNRKIIFH